jgi:NAD-dependent DNA ligase
LQIQPPTNCPSCDSELEWSKDQLYCRNVSCPAKSFKQLEHFAKTLKIKGLGPSTIEKLDITTIPEIYELTVEYISVQLNSERLSVKLFEEIEKSKNEPLNTVLPAFGIPLIGKSATDKLAATCSDIFDIDEPACKKAGLGPKATENLMNWMEYNWGEYSQLPFTFEFSNNTRPTESRGVVCISGKLKSFKTKAQAAEILQGLGYTIKDSLTKEVTILVSESGQTAKTQKAEENGIRVVTNIQELMENI